jgi:hypothetical protein
MLLFTHIIDPNVTSQRAPHRDARRNMHMSLRPGVATLVLAASALLCQAQAAPVPATAAAREPALGIHVEAAAASFDGVVSFINSVTPSDGSKPSWGDVRKQALELSSKQRGGRPETLRYCEPELKVCNVGVVWRTSNGTRMFLRQAEDLSGKSLEREVCEINSFGDVRVCVDWDTNSKHRDMKDVKGHWYNVADR